MYYALGRVLGPLRVVPLDKGPNGMDAHNNLEAPFEGELHFQALFEGATVNARVDDRLQVET